MQKSDINTVEKIHQAALKFLVPLNPEETYATIVKEAVKLVQADFGSLHLENHGELERVYSTAPFLYKLKTRKRGFTFKAFKSMKASVLDIKRVGPVHPMLKKMGLKSIVYIPLTNQNKPFGVLSLDSKNHKHFTPEHLQTLKLFGSLATLAIRKTQLYDETRKAVEVRDLFISMAAHELRTPLTTIYGYIQLLQKKISPLNSMESEWTDKLFLEIKRLTTLVNEILEINKIRSGKVSYSFTECSMENILGMAVNNLSVMYPKRKITVNNTLNGLGGKIIGDCDKLLQVLINLLENARKFSPESSIISVALSAKNGYIILEIKDRGKGIAQEDIPKVFDEFYKGKDEFKSGMGLGLFLVKNIIKKHNGSIKLTSRLQKGTLVQVKLPMAHI
ncbi:MAG TPA: GAF domain-containing sensor histidine kinase [Candidatus Saccharimonadales bacterium]|nr:GAF domain-containing sensor histidine kinase [Candidatus Saccharimonadales bacterium]